MINLNQKNPFTISKSPKNYNFLSFLQEKLDPKLIEIPSTSSFNLYQGIRLSDNKKILIKRLILDDIDLFTQIQNELEHQKSLINIHIDTNIDIYYNQSVLEIYIIKEPYKLSLNSLAISLEEGVGLPEEEILQVFTDISDGLIFSHSLNITHSDITPAKILLFVEDKRPNSAQKLNVKLNKNTYKLTDFQIENIITQYKSLKKTKINNDYGIIVQTFAPPEKYDLKNIKNLDYKAVDVYSLAMSLINLCGIPIKKLHPISLSEKELHDFQIDKIIKEKLIKFYNWQFIEILKGMLKFDSNERWNMDQVCLALRSLSKPVDFGSRSSEFIEEKQEKEKKIGVFSKIMSKLAPKHQRRGSKISYKKELSENPENNIDETNIEFKFNTNNIFFHIISKEDYKTLISAKPIKHYKKFTNEIAELNSLWGQIKPITVNKLNLEVHTENELGDELLELVLEMIRDKGKMNIVKKFSIVSVFEKLVGEMNKFLDNNYFAYFMKQNQNFNENTFNFTHFYNKNQNDGMSLNEITEILKILYFFNKNELKCLNLVIRSFDKFTDLPLLNLSQLIYLYSNNLEELNLFISGQSISDSGINNLFQKTIEALSKKEIIPLKYFSIGINSSNLLTNDSLISLTKMLITISSKTKLARLMINIASSSIDNEGMENLSAGLESNAKNLVSLTIIINSWDKVSDSGIYKLLNSVLRKAKLLKRFTFAVRSVAITQILVKNLENIINLMECELTVFNIFLEKIANRNIQMEKDFKDFLLIKFPRIQIGEIIIKLG